MQATANTPEISTLTAEYWRMLGFEEIGTGGGCTAYQHQVDGIGYILVTTVDASVPDRLTDEVTVGFYPDGFDNQCTVYVNCDNSYEAAALLDRIGAEWSIPR